MEARLARRPPAHVAEGDLPAAVRRWLDLALPAERPRPRTVRFEQAFAMRLGSRGRFTPGRALQVVAGGETAFAWLAEIRVAPGVRVTVTDAVVDGEGVLDARLLGVVPIARGRGPSLTRGEVIRLLMELPWAPTVALTNPGLRWAASGEDRVDVSARVGGVEGRATLVFGSDGLPAASLAEGRPRREGGTDVERPCRGSFSGYRRLGATLVPAFGEVAWELPEGPLTYWRGEIVRHAAAGG